MLRELVRVSCRFRQEGKLPPTGYKRKSPKWIVNMGGGKPHLEGPYEKKDIRIFAPDRQRGGTPSEGNLKPYLLLDDTRYALGKAEQGQEREVALLHGGFIALLQAAHQATGLAEFAVILDFLASKELEAVRKKVEPRDLVTFRVNGRDLIEDPKVQRFWASYLAQELESKDPTTCGVCGRSLPVVRILPREIVVLGQKCQVTSFNRNSFLSYGKAQTANAPICFECASNAIDALDYLIRTEQRRRTLFFDREASSLENQLAVYWLERPAMVRSDEQVLDVEALLGSFLNDGPKATSAPPAELSQLQALLSSPWIANQAALNLDETRFYLAVLSANKGRLVVREWLEASLRRIRVNLAKFLEATRVVSSGGDSVRPYPIATVVEALGSTSPNLVRGLLRTAYLGYAPPANILGLALPRIRTLILNETALRERNRKSREKLWDENWLPALFSAIKAGIFYGTEEVERMSELNPQHSSQAYLCGRLLAVLEEAQLRASNFKLNKTLVDRFYGAASTAPAATFGGLVRLATTAHLPKVGKEVNLWMEEVMSGLDELGGFPKTLTLAEQAEFGLGFYHQRSTFRAGRGKNKVDANAGTSTKGGQQ